MASGREVLQPCTGWKGWDKNGLFLPSRVHMYRLTAGSFKKAGKLTLIR